MKTFEACYLPATNLPNPSRGGFKTEEDAWEYIESRYCKVCKKILEDGKETMYCSAEWDVFEEEK